MADSDENDFWKKAGRHSSQGCLLSDLVGYDRMKELVDSAKVFRDSSFSSCSFSYMNNLLSIQFLGLFLGGFFGPGISMPEAAGIFVEGFLLDMNNTQIQLRHELVGTIRRRDEKKFREIHFAMGTIMKLTSGQITTLFNTLASEENRNGFESRN